MRLICFFPLLLSLLSVSPASASSSLEVIVHPSNAQQSLSRQGLRAIFSMRWQTWEDSTPIRVYVLADSHAVHTQFTKQYIGVFPHQLRKAWDRLVFSGTGQAPVEVETVEEMINKVNSTPGAIGYITSDKLNESTKSIQVK